MLPVVKNKMRNRYGPKSWFYSAVLVSHLWTCEKIAGSKHAKSKCVIQVSATRDEECTVSKVLIQAALQEPCGGFHHWWNCGAVFMNGFPFCLFVSCALLAWAPGYTCMCISMWVTWYKFLLTVSQHSIDECTKKQHSLSPTCYVHMDVRSRCKNPLETFHEEENALCGVLLRSNKCVSVRKTTREHHSFAYQKNPQGVFKIIKMS